MFYEIIKLHPFLNGNKRIACVALLVFLAMNNKWIDFDWQELYYMAKEVAKSPTDRREEILEKVRGIIDKNMVDRGI